jgi:hypothetical protein
LHDITYFIIKQKHRKAIGFVSVEGRSLFSFEDIGDQFLYVLRGDRWLIWRNRRSGFWGGEGRSLFDIEI